MNFYGNSSPWSKTPFNNAGYLDFMNIRRIPADADDLLYEIQSQYVYRPDLLAYDLYQNSKLWWVFSMRNQDTLKDPVFDFLPGTKIYLPKASKIRLILGN